ncbi:MAG: histone deacetylase [Betaproteobacteria bacterium]
MNIYYTDHYVLPLPTGHRFPMRKYSALRERVAAVAAPLLREPAAATRIELESAHDPAYVAAVCTGTLDAAAIRRIGFPWSLAMVERSRRSTGATIAACRGALADGCSINLAGGTHHAHASFGEGFCVFNDAAVAARVLQAERLVDHVLIVDLDVHQGDGTAAIFADDPTVFTLSMHGRGNFPFRKAQSDLDVDLDDGAGDKIYLATLDIMLSRVFERTRPALAIYLAGADPYVGDRLGKLALTKTGLQQRDAYVLNALRTRGIPVAVVMAGGYADRIEDIVDIHFATVTTALAQFGCGGVMRAPAKPHISPRATTRNSPARGKAAC